MKNFEELSEINSRAYLIENQVVAFALACHPSLPITINCSYLIEGRYFGLISIENVYHMLTEQNSYYIGLSYHVACGKFYEFLAEQLDESLATWLKDHMGKVFLQY